MITAERILDFLEKKLTPVKAYKKEVNRFENPDDSDLEELRTLGVKEVGFIADARVKKVFVWDSTLAIPTELSSGLVGVSGGDIDAAPFIVYGTAGLSDTGLFLRDKQDIIISRIGNMSGSVLDKKWGWSKGWVDKYISGFSSNFMKHSKSLQSHIFLKNQKSSKSEKK